MKYLLLILVLLTSCKKETAHRGKVRNHYISSGYFMTSYTMMPVGKTFVAIPHQIYIPDSKHLIIEEDTYSFIFDPTDKDYVSFKDGDSIYYMR